MRSWWLLRKLILVMERLEDQQVAEWRVQLSGSLFQLANLALGSLVFTQLIGQAKPSLGVSLMAVTILIVCYTLAIVMLLRKDQHG